MIKILSGFFTSDGHARKSPWFDSSDSFDSPHVSWERFAPSTKLIIQNAVFLSNLNQPDTTYAMTTLQSDKQLTATHRFLTGAKHNDFAPLHVNELRSLAIKMGQSVTPGYVYACCGKPSSQRPSKGFPRNLWDRTAPGTFAVSVEYRSDPRILTAIAKTEQYLVRNTLHL